MNESILYTVDSIHNAISTNRKVRFKYFDYDLKMKKVFRRNGEHYTANPLALTFDNEALLNLAELLSALPRNIDSCR